jgi:arylsulfatase A-like enzyme
VEPGSEGLVSPQLDIPLRDLRAIEIRMAASSGERLRLWWRGSGPFHRKFSLVSEIKPGAQVVSYIVKTSTLRGYEGLRLTGLRLDPTDGAPADVAVESIGLIGREGLYEGKDHGIGQENLANQVRHVLYHRAPSRITWEASLPPAARLDVGAGLLDAGEGADLSILLEDRGKTFTLWRQRITDDSSWHDVTVDLSRWAGRHVGLAFDAATGRPGQVVLWSNPMVASRLPASGTAPPPNVLIYLVDTLRADRLRAYGGANPTSPALDRLAAEGVMFQNCSASASWTRPSVASLLTSLAPPSHGVTDHGLAIPAGVVTLAEQMRQAGYVTAAFITSTHAGSSANLQQGYDFMYESPAVTGDVRLIEQGRKKDFSRKKSSLINKALLPWLERYGERPFFLYLHAMDPHSPYLPPEPYDRMFATGYDGPVNGGLDEKTGFAAARTRQELDHILSLYDAEIRYTDDRIGELLDALRARGVLDRTLVVITSDHGEEFREHGGFEHGQSLYRELLDVPLVMRLPGVLPAGVRVQRRVSGLDVMPTVLDIAGIEPNADVQGSSLLGMGGQGSARGDAFSSGAGAGGAVFSWRQTKKSGEEVSIERGPLKAYVTGDGRVRLFDRTSDPFEQRDVSGERPEEARVLGEEARLWLRSLPRITTPGESTRVTVDEEERRWLKALGYIR